MFYQNQNHINAAGVFLAAFFLVFSANATSFGNHCEQEGFLTAWMEDCALPAVGESKIASIPIAGNSSPAFQYKITRLATSSEAPSIEIAVPIHFSKKWEPVMRERAAKCLKDATPFLRGPDGARLSVRLADPAEAMKSSMVEVSKGNSSDAGSWSEEIECSQILHEVLHLTGLVDEYADEEGKFACRAIGPKDSLMYNPRHAYRSVNGACMAKKYVLVKGDEIAARDAVEKFYAEPKNLGKAPVIEGFEFEASSVEDHPHFPLKADGTCESALDNHGKDGKRAAFYVFVPTPKWSDTVLKSGQFNKIAYPNCSLTNQSYDECAAFAYLPKKQNGCAAVPPACRSTDWVGK